MSTRWTEADVMAHNARMKLGKDAHPAEYVAAPKPSKYRNVKTVIDGITFDSKREAQHWAELKMREKVGEIAALSRQHSYALYAPVVGGAPLEFVVVSHYVADFVYTDTRTGHTHVVDAKGKRTAMYQLKKKWLELQSGIVIEEV
jgi:hypothetical protein